MYKYLQATIILSSPSIPSLKSTMSNPSAPADLERRLNEGTAMLIPGGRFAMGFVRFYDSTQTIIASKASGNDIVVVLLNPDFAIMANIPPRVTGKGTSPQGEDAKVDRAIRQLLNQATANRIESTPYGAPPSYEPSKVWIFGPVDLLDPELDVQLNAVHRYLGQRGIKPLQHLTDQTRGQKRTILVSHESRHADIPRVFLNGNPVPFN